MKEVVHNIIQINFNWRVVTETDPYSSTGELKHVVEFDSYRVGIEYIVPLPSVDECNKYPTEKTKCVHISEIQNLNTIIGYAVIFKNGSCIKIYNPNEVFFDKVRTIDV